MIGKLALALSAPILLSNTERGPEYDTAPVLVDVPGIAQVMCKEGSGSAFRTGSHAYTSVRHVTSLTNCTIEGKPIVTTLASEPLDFSSNRVAFGGNYHRISCEGFKPGEDYVAIGFARGTTPYMRATAVRLADPETAMDNQWGNFTVMVGDGRFIPGQSGAPVFRVSTGEVVGIVKGYQTLSRLSYARDISTTPLCTGHI